MINVFVMKKLLTVTALVAGVALFAGCMDKPEVEETTEATGVVVEETTTAEVLPAEETNVATGTTEATTTTETPTPTAE